MSMRPPVRHIAWWRLHTSHLTNCGLATWEPRYNDPTIGGVLKRWAVWDAERRALVAGEDRKRRVTLGELCSPCLAGFATQCPAARDCMAAASSVSTKGTNKFWCWHCFSKSEGQHELFCTVGSQEPK